MRIRQLIPIVASWILVGWGLESETAFAQEYEVYPLEARVWLDRGAEPVLQRGERVRIYYRVSESAFVSIFHIDTNGTVRMVFPSSPQENHYARGGRDYRVLFPGSSYWYVADHPGVGYYFIVASPEPFDFSQFGYSHYAGGWDLGMVGRQVYGDPYLAMDDFVASLIPDWEYVGYGLDFTAYHVERHYDYPRFLCYDCHGFQPYYSWNPYRYSCSSFRVVIYNDPYYYPATRYRGTRVVYVQPRRGVAHFGFKERAVGEPGTPQVVVRTTPPVSRPGVEGTQQRRAVPRSGSPSAFSPGTVGGNPPGVTGQSRPGVEGTATRRSGSAGSGSTVPSTARANPGSAGTSGTTGRPVLERRPTRPGSSATSSGTTQPTRNPASRPSSRVRRPGSGGGTTGGTATRSPPTTGSGGATVRSAPTTRGTGTATRSSPTVRTNSGSSRSSGVVRSNGGATRSSPTVRSTGGTTRSAPTVRTTGGASRSTGTSGQRTPTVRSGGSTGKPAARTNPPRKTRPPTPPKPKKPRGGGGGTPTL